jgi:hypothetical protein
MRIQSFVWVAVAACALASPCAATAADLAPADPICPRAVPKIVTFNDAAASKDVAKIAVAARSIADTYEVCASDAQVAKGVAVEPTVNYDKTRAAQYLVVLGRALAATGKTPEAVTAFKTARRYADEVATWQPDAQMWHASATSGGAGPNPGRGRPDDATGPQTGGNTAARNTDRNGSRYREAAVQIRAAADGELATLEPPQPATPIKPN